MPNRPTNRRLAAFAALAFCAIAAAAAARAWRERVQFLDVDTLTVREVVLAETAAPTATDLAGASVSISAAQAGASSSTFWTCSYAGAVALQLPAADAVPHGTRISIKRLAANSAITITSAGSSTLCGIDEAVDDLDTIGDSATFEGDAFANDWLVANWIIDMP